MAKKAKKKSAPKPRHTWAINPKTRVKPSKKHYKRKEGKSLERFWQEEIGRFRGLSAR